MARPTEWRRTWTSFADNQQQTFHDVRTVAIFAGETVSRVHVQYQCSAFPEVPLAPWANVLLFGVWLQNDLTDVPALDLTQDAGSEEWMWWEGAGWRQEAFGFRTNEQDPVEVISAPRDGGYRDIKAQRICTADGALWVATKGEPAGGNQTNHWLSVAVSVLVTLPA